MNARSRTDCRPSMPMSRHDSRRAPVYDAEAPTHSIRESSVALAELEAVRDEMTRAGRGRQPSGFVSREAEDEDEVITSIGVPPTGRRRRQPTKDAVETAPDLRHLRPSGPVWRNEITAEAQPDSVTCLAVAPASRFDEETVGALEAPVPSARPRKVTGPSYREATPASSRRDSSAPGRRDMPVPAASTRRSSLLPPVPPAPSPSSRRTSSAPPAFEATRRSAVSPSAAPSSARRSRSEVPPPSMENLVRPTSRPSIPSPAIHERLDADRLFSSSLAVKLEAVNAPSLRAARQVTGPHFESYACPEPVAPAGEADLADYRDQVAQVYDANQVQALMAQAEEEANRSYAAADHRAPYPAAEHPAYVTERPRRLTITAVVLAFAALLSFVAMVAAILFVRSENEDAERTARMATRLEAPLPAALPPAEAPKPAEPEVRPAAVIPTQPSTQVIVAAEPPAVVAAKEPAPVTEVKDPAPIREPAPAKAPAIARPAPRAAAAVRAPEPPRPRPAAKPADVSESEPRSKQKEMAAILAKLSEEQILR